MNTVQWLGFGGSTAFSIVASAWIVARTPVRETKPHRFSDEPLLMAWGERAREDRRMKWGQR